VPSAVIGIPSRYIHSHASIIDKEDYEAAKRLLYSLVRKLDKSTWESILPR
jgi:putative aminopeptidase FrvX